MADADAAKRREAVLFYLSTTLRRLINPAAGNDEGTLQLHWSTTDCEVSGERRESRQPATQGSDPRSLAYGGRFSPENEMPVIDLLLRELKQGRLSVPDFEVSGRGRTGAEQEWVWRKVKLRPAELPSFPTDDAKFPADEIFPWELERVLSDADARAAEVFDRSALRGD